MTEVWKPVPKYESWYEVSNLGRVKRKFSIDNGGRRLKERILKGARQNNGYVYVSLCGATGVKQMRVHRIVAEVFIPNPEEKPFVNHINGNKEDNRVDNLEWVTGSENMRHAYVTGLQIPLKRESSPSAILNETQIIEIRACYIPRDSKYGQSALSRKYGVSRSCIEDIVHGRTWR